MAFVERLLPRHWDVRRLMGFLAGLALIALSFTAGAQPAQATPAPATASAITTPMADIDQPARFAAPVDSGTAPVMVVPAGRSGPAGDGAEFSAVDAPAFAAADDAVTSPLAPVAAAATGGAAPVVAAAAVIRGSATGMADAECEHDASPRGPPLG